MKGIILAGGQGTRLKPLTLTTNKHLLPIFNKPMIYYPLCLLMLLGIREIQLLINPEDESAFKKIFKDGSQWGIHISFLPQAIYKGLGYGLLLSKSFLANSTCVLILGDNYFYKKTLIKDLKKNDSDRGATIIVKKVTNTIGLGVMEFDSQFRPINIVKDSNKSKSKYAITGLYFYDKNVAQIAEKIYQENNKVEITDINRYYLQHHELNVQLLESDVDWWDCGTHESLFSANAFEHSLSQLRDSPFYPELIAYRLGYISETEFRHLTQDFGLSQYREYLLRELLASS